MGILEGFFPGLWSRLGRTLGRSLSLYMEGILSGFFKVLLCLKEAGLSLIRFSGSAESALRFTEVELVAVLRWLTLTLVLLPESGGPAGCSMDW